MECNNTHCKHYKPAEHSSELDRETLGLFYVKKGGCKFPYCKKNKKKTKYK